MSIRSIVALIGVVMASSVAADEVITAKKLMQGPSVDGIADSVWQDAPVTTISVARIPEAIVTSNREKQTGKYADNWKKDKYTGIEKVDVRAVYTATHIYFLFTWSDATMDDQHKPWNWKGSKTEGEYVAGPEREDRLAVSFPIKGEFVANKLTATESVMDVWHWKAARTNGIGLAHDKYHVVSKTRPAGTSAQHFDANGTEVFIARPDDAGDEPYESNKVDPFTYQGDTVPAYIPKKPTEPNALDVAAVGKWGNGGWTLEVGRKLFTGHAETDTTFDPAKGSKMALAVFDHAGDHFHAVSGVVEVKFEQ